MPRNPNSAVLAGLLLLAMLAGCSKEDKPSAVADPKQAQQPKPAPPVQKQLSSATKTAGSLEFKNRTDPFRPIVKEVAPPVKTTKPRGRHSGDLLPIQGFEVSKFKVAGIITGLKENRALVLDPNGKGYVIQVGMPIGNNEGRVTAITASSVEVVEDFREDSGRVRKTKIVLPLAKKR